MLSPLVSLPRPSGCLPAARLALPPGDPVAPPLDQVTILCAAQPIPAQLVWSGVAAGLGAAALAGWSNAAMCPICTWNGGCIKQLGHVGAHQCGQGHRWGA